RVCRAHLAVSHPLESHHRLAMLYLQHSSSFSLLDTSKRSFPLSKQKFSNPALSSSTSLFCRKKKKTHRFPPSSSFSTLASYQPPLLSMNAVVFPKIHAKRLRSLLPLSSLGGMCVSQETIRGNVHPELVCGILSTIPALPEPHMKILLPCKKCYRTYGADASGEICRITKLHLEPNFCDPQNSYNSETPLDVIHSIIEALRSTVESYRRKELLQEVNSSFISTMAENPSKKEEATPVCPLPVKLKKTNPEKCEEISSNHCFNRSLGRILHILQDENGKLRVALLSMDGKILQWMNSDSFLQHCFGGFQQGKSSILSVQMEVESSPWRHFPQTIEFHVDASSATRKGKRSINEACDEQNGKHSPLSHTSPVCKRRKQSVIYDSPVSINASPTTCPDFSSARQHKRPTALSKSSVAFLSALSQEKERDSHLFQPSPQEEGLKYVDTFYQIREVVMASSTTRLHWLDSPLAETPASHLPYLKYLCIEILSTLLPLWISSHHWHGVTAYMHLHFLMKASSCSEIHLYLHVFLSEIFYRELTEAETAPSWVDLTTVASRVSAYVEHSSSRLPAVGKTLEIIRQFMADCGNGVGSSLREEATGLYPSDEGKCKFLGKVNPTNFHSISSEMASAASASHSPSVEGGDMTEGLCVQEQLGIIRVGGTLPPSLTGAEVVENPQTNTACTIPSATISSVFVPKISGSSESTDVIPSPAAALLPIVQVPPSSSSLLRQRSPDFLASLSTPKDAKERTLVNLAAYREPLVDVMDFLNYSKASQTLYLKSLMQKHIVFPSAMHRSQLFPPSSPKSVAGQSNTSSSSISGTSGEHIHGGKKSAPSIGNPPPQHEDEEKRRYIRPGLKVAGKRVKRGEKYKYLWFSRAFLEYMGGIREETDDHAVFQYFCHYAKQCGLTQEKNGRFLMDASLKTWLGDMMYLPRSRRIMLEALQHQNHLHYEVLL
ncbi:hypothetical protein IE077_002815, partial [Cardiosporidium cionae]